MEFFLCFNEKMDIVKFSSELTFEIKKRGDTGPTKSLRQMILRDDDVPQDGATQTIAAEETTADGLDSGIVATSQAIDSEMVDIEQENT